MRLKNLIRRTFKNWSLLVLVALLTTFPLVASWSQANTSEDSLRTKAEEISTLTNSIRSYYADNVISRIIAAEGQAKLSENYRNLHGGVPIPATFSIEMGALFDGSILDKRVSYKFISDYPFKNREPHQLDTFEKTSLKQFRENPLLQEVSDHETHFFQPSKYRLITPITMKASCVECHNAHPGSIKRDWKIGDVRGIQEVTVKSNPLSSISKGWPLVTGYASIICLLGLYNVKRYKDSSAEKSNIINLLNLRLDREKTLTEAATKRLDQSKIYKYSIENSVVGVTICDMTKPDGPAIYVNDAFTKITGYSKKYAIGKNCRYLQGPKTNPEEIKKIREAIHAGEPYTGKFINYRSDGTTFMNQLTLVPIKSESGTKVIYYLANQIESKEEL